MGIINETARFLCEARQDGVSFRNTLTIGRHLLYVDDRTLRALADQSDIDSSVVTSVKGIYSEGFFRRFLLAEEVASLDKSAYEGADIKHDLNSPVPPSLECKYDAVVDAGTLEHVFNFPVAVANCMRMVKTGGRLFIFTPANNQLGHGFYQFSPELFFRVLCPNEGFQIERLVAVQFKYMGAEHGSFKKQYEVRDPNLVGARVTLANSRPVSLLVQAKKIQHKSGLFSEHPQQSDYERLWKAAQTETHAKIRSHESATTYQRLLRVTPRPVKDMVKTLLGLIPRSAKTIYRNEYEKYFVHSFRNRSSYVPASRGEHKS